jgi:hypothetical protein
MVVLCMTTRVERGEWDSNPSCMDVESSVTVEIIDLVIMNDIYLCFDVRL